MNSGFDLKSKPRDFQNLFLDMDSFFASVEEQVQPRLRGLPVGITPYTGDTGCIIAASREAKNLGVKTGFGVGEARLKIPQIKIIEARPALYMIYHDAIKKALESLTPFYEPLSVDEFLIYLAPSEQNFRSSCRLGETIKTKIREDVGDYLTCSVGIGPTRFLAKMAAESDKPNGLATLELFELKRFYESLTSLKDLTGINTQLEKLLHSFGVYSVGDFYRLDLTKLVKIMNHWGRMWYYRLRGYEVDDYVSKTRNVGHSHVLTPDLRTRVGAESVIKKLIFKASSRLRAKGLTASGVFVAVRFMDKTSFSKSRRVQAFSDNFSFTKAVFGILENCEWQAKPLLVSVSAFGLKKNFKHNSQISIFPEIERLRRASVAMDKLNDKLGNQMIHPASMHSAVTSAPDRIPYGKPRYGIRFK